MNSVTMCTERPKITVLHVMTGRLPYPEYPVFAKVQSTYLSCFLNLIRLGGIYGRHLNDQEEMSKVHNPA